MIKPVNQGKSPEEIEKLILDGFEEYRRACYGDQVTSGTQFVEVRQAFLSGVLWANTHPQDIKTAILVLAKLCKAGIGGT